MVRHVGIANCQCGETHCKSGKLAAWGVVCRILSRSAYGPGGAVCKIRFSVAITVAVYVCNLMKMLILGDDLQSFLDGLDPTTEGIA